MINTLNGKRTKKSWDPTPKIPATLSTLFYPKLLLKEQKDIIK